MPIKQSQKIDVVVAPAPAELGAVKGGQVGKWQASENSIEMKPFAPLRYTRPLTESR